MECVMDVCEKENGIIESVKVNNSSEKNVGGESEPVTPESVRENGDLHSPLTLSPPVFDHAHSLSDQDMFQSLYHTLLHLILSKLTEEGVLSQQQQQQQGIQLSNVLEYDSDDCKTPPPSSFLLLQQLDTCPRLLPPSSSYNN